MPSERDTGADASVCRPGTAGRNDTPLIALAEDDPALRSLLAAALERSGYEVVQVATGAQLVAAVEGLLAGGAPLRLIISDVHMPALGGLEAARALRHTGDAVPLLLMTAYGNAWTRAQAAGLGATLLDKPLSLHDLRAAVKRALGC